MKKASYWLLTGLILLFAQCQKESLGLSLIPDEDKLQTNLIDTVTVNFVTEPDNHVNTYGKTFVLLGSYIDPIFGKTKAGFVTQMAQLKYPEHQDSVVVDSVVMFLSVDKSFVPYGNIYNPLPIKVYKLKDTLTETEYYSDDSPSKYTDFEEIGSENFLPYANGNDSGIVIHLETQFVQDMFDNADYYFYTENDPFSNRFYGLYVAIDSTASDDLSLFKINIEGISNTLYVYYHLSNYPDSNFTYAFSLYGGINKHFSLIEHDYSGTDVFNPAVDSVAYLQSLAGTKIKLLFPYIQNLQGGIVEKAELILKLAPSQYTYQPTYPPLDKIYFAKFYSNSTQAYTVDDFYSPTTGYQGIDLGQNEYRINLTRIIQHIIDGTDEIEDSTFNYYLYDVKSGENILRSVINTQNNSNPSKLVIIYSQPNKN